MNFSDLITKRDRPYKVMNRRAPYTVPDTDLSNWLMSDVSDIDQSPCWYIEVFP